MSAIKRRGIDWCPIARTSDPLPTLFVTIPNQLNKREDNGPIDQRVIWAFRAMLMVRRNNHTILNNEAPKASTNLLANARKKHSTCHRSYSFSGTQFLT